ncbi:unnamed protein product [Soboliphyme baturini]|uniref:7-dehydrocholesterol reductase n=1 Tax=Soboliphyme baturini TaxID=241478 RepID=A0A183IJK0_9BILA|nr:unnamed protein product [Soboliphyme baturini]
MQRQQRHSIDEEVLATSEEEEEGVKENPGVVSRSILKSEESVDMRKLSTDPRPGGTGSAARRISVPRLQDLGHQQTGLRSFSGSEKTAENYALLLSAVVTSSTLFLLVLYQCVLHQRESCTGYVQYASSQGLVEVVGRSSRWLAKQLTDSFAWKFVLSFAALQLAVLRSFPAVNQHRSKKDPAHETRPDDFRSGGVFAFFANLLFYLFLSCVHVFHMYSLYDHVLAVLFVFLIISFVTASCLVLPAASSTSAPKGCLNFLCGTHKNPEVNELSLRQIFSSRFYMLMWQLVLLSCVSKRFVLYGDVPDSMLVSVLLQLLYIAKYFFFEPNYLSTQEITYRHVGFIYLWNSVFFQPALCWCSSIYMVQNASGIGRSASIVLDSYFLKARYKTPSGLIKSSLLLGNGWWGVCRHLNYTTEVLAIAFWTTPVCSATVLPYVYVLYVGCFLLVRSFQDDARCRMKYGIYWEQYCRQVPYSLVPALW